MELSNDQKAILRLLAQRGAAGYDDLTALMGISTAEVHEKAKAAAAQLEAEGIPAPSIPAPGDAEPDSPGAPAALAQPPEPEPEPVTMPAPQPATPPAPVEVSPTAPTVAATPEPPRKDPPKSPGSGPKLTLPSGGGARAALAAGALVVVALVLILALGGGEDSDDSGSGSTATGSEAAEETVSASTNPKLTQAVLDPIDGSDAKGVATFGRVKNSLALQVEAEGLEPTAKGDAYTIWLYESPQKMLPLASTAVGENGRIAAQVQVPTEVLAYLANETFGQLDISLTTEATLKASLAKATKEKKAPIYTGTDVLRGTISGPIVGAASR